MNYNFDTTCDANFIAIIRKCAPIVFGSFRDVFGSDALSCSIAFRNDIKDTPRATARRQLPGAFTEDYRVNLTPYPNDPRNTIYQLSHELGHVIMDINPENPQFKWVSECICELMSIQMLEAFYTKGNMRKFGLKPQSVIKYINECFITSNKYWNLGDLQEYCKNNIADFEQNANGPIAGGIRWRNTEIAKFILRAPQFSVSALTAAVAIAFDCSKISCSIDFIHAWRDRCSDKSLPDIFLSLFS